MYFRTIKMNCLIISIVFTIFMMECESFTSITSMYQLNRRLLMKAASGGAGSGSGWSFDKGAGSLKDLGAIGNEGELYFHPNKLAKLSPAKILGKSRTIPIFPQQNVLLPGSTEWIHVFGTYRTSDSF
jgi:hypothetical protein